MSSAMQATIGMTHSAFVVCHFYINIYYMNIYIYIALEFYGWFGRSGTKTHVYVYIYIYIYMRLGTTPTKPPIEF